MHYSIREVADMSGVSTRTLRYYDQIGLLCPASYTEKGYRLYDSKCLDLLQVILFLKSMNLSLNQIQSIITHKVSDLTTILVEQREHLIAQQSKIEGLITLLEQTIAAQQEGIMMEDKQKFEAFKQNEMEQNRKQYGEEVIEKYGEQKLEDAENHFGHLSRFEYEQAEQAEKRLFESIRHLIDNDVKEKDLQQHPSAQKAFKAHQSWLKIMSGQYSTDYHLAMADLYKSDGRFSDYYNAHIGSDMGTEMLSAVIYSQIKK